MSNTTLDKVTMGIIYMITSPSGKSYIGQTVRTFNERWSKHKSNAMADDPSCRALAEAIKKYGEASFQTQTLLECDDEQLDDYEIEMIAKYNTLSPHGYNLREGGNTTRYSVESRQKMSDTQKHLYQTSQKMRDHLKNNGHKTKQYKELPDYLTVEKNYKTNVIIGYRVYRHPMCKKSKKFCSSKLSLEENLQRATEYLVHLNTLTTPVEFVTAPIVGRTRTGDLTLPKYVVEVKDRVTKELIGYSVNIRNKTTDVRKSFVGQDLTLEEKKTLAINFVQEQVNGT